MSKLKRCLAVLLVLCMLVSVVPTWAAQPTENAAGQQITAEEIPGDSRLESSTNTSDESPAAPYADDELVTVIVELEESPVMDYYGVSAYALNATENAGASVSAFLASDDAAALSGLLQEQQTDVLAELTAALGSKPQVVDQWTELVNAVAVRIPYGQLETVRALDGVKRANVERTYERPEEPTTEAGSVAGYSYDMAAIQEVWNAGYTGKGMLVAVLDTGLDLNWQAYADPHIVSVHEAFTDDSFKSDDAVYSLRYTSDSLAAFLKANTLNAEFRGGNTELTYDFNALYKNLKVPFAYDYADLDLNVNPSDSDHGTHVSGTILGYAEDAEGVVKFSGVAPDAQLLAMKVFADSDGGALESDIIAAMEDAMKLGADVINLSLGSDNGFAQDDTTQQEISQRVREAGVLMMTSAGNAYYSSLSNNRGDYNLSSDPEISMISSPALYASNLAIASINSTVDVQTVFTWTDLEGVEHEVAYLDPTGTAMKYQFVGQEPVSIIHVEGTGTYNDYYNAGFRSYSGWGEKGVSGVALVQRGELSFADKINNASNFWWGYYDSARGTYVSEKPVKAVLIYDNVTGELINMSTDYTSITSAFISKADGEAIIEAINAGCDVKMSVQAVDNLVTWEQGGQMSEFSSWGAGPSLELKPEITAPGGNIWSSITGGSSADGSTGSYGMMSGTSMSAPHMSGITALVEQYVHSKSLTSKQADADLTSQLMVSTALPQQDGSTYYSPRLQGAGLVNAAAAIQTPAYITVDGQSVGKLELKDDPERTGEYTLSFNVVNMGHQELRYSAKAVLLRPATGTTEDGCTTILDSDVLIREVDLGTITVAGMSSGAFASTSVSRTVSLTDAEKAELDELFANGTYVEGYVILTAENGTDPQIGLPFLAFYGDWTAAPIFDSAVWTDEVAEGESFLNLDSTWGTSVVGYATGLGFYNLGQNPFDSSAGETQAVYYQENFAISPDNVYGIRSVNDFVLYQLRQARLVVVEVHDKDSGELYYHDVATYQLKTIYNSSYGYAIPTSVSYFTGSYFTGTDLEGNPLPDGTQCVCTITAYGDGDYGDEVYYEDYDMYATDFMSVDPNDPSTEPTFNGHAMDKTGDVISFDVLIDKEAPMLVNNAVSILEKDGKITLSGSVQDNDGSIASITVYPQVKRTYKTGYGDPSYVEYGVDKSNPFCDELVFDPDTHELSFSCDVTSYEHTNESYAGENYYYNYEWTGNLYIYCGDYAGNDRAYAVALNTDPGLVLSQTSALLYVGSEFDLSVIDNTESGLPITRVSTNPEVASVDETGHVVALSVGQTSIVVSNGQETVQCIVAVREKTTEVLDFSLSMESFSGLKPNGAVVVKVVDLQPADVVLEEIIWDVREDDETAQYYEGLITCSRYTTDGLSAEVYLSGAYYDAYNSGDPLIPGGSGVLTVTLNGVSRTMDIDWTDLYKNSYEDDLVSDLYGKEQTIYVTQGETATLVARYNNSSDHSALPVALYSLAGASNYSSTNPKEESVGLVLDGPPTVATGGAWTGKLVNLEGYALPEHIEIGCSYPYSDGSEYEYWWQNSSYSSFYTYDSTTGEITVRNGPYGSNNTMIIRADGVESPGNPAGTLSGITYEAPEPLYGPFDWAATEGYTLSGELSTEEGVTINYAEKNVAYYTPSEPGVSYITATTKDGKYSLNFAVVCEPALAEKLEMNTHNLEMTVGDTAQLEVSFEPEPTLEQHKELIWTSYNPEVATVDENGVITAVSEGYAYVQVAAKVTPEQGVTVQSYCIVHVNPLPSYTVTFMADGNVVGTVTKTRGEYLNPEDYPEVPAKEGYDGVWETVDEPITGDRIVNAIYTVHVHDTELVGAKEPTCTEDGYTGDLICKNCGETVEQGQVIPATGHDYQDGVCTNCGAEEPDYEEPGVKTGDTSNITLWLAVMASTAILAAAALVLPRKKRS